MPGAAGEKGQLGGKNKKGKVPHIVLLLSLPFSSGSFLSHSELGGSFPLLTL